MIKIRRLTKNTPEARVINAILDELDRLQPKQGTGIKIRRSPDGFTISADAKEQKAGSDTGVWLP